MRVRAMSNGNGKGSTTIIVSLPPHGDGGGVATTTPAPELDNCHGGPTGAVGGIVAQQESTTSPGGLVMAGSAPCPTSSKTAGQSTADIM